MMLSAEAGMPDLSIMEQAAKEVEATYSWVYVPVNKARSLGNAVAVADSDPDQ